MRIALTPPSHCSVCFNQDPSALHVDMEAATDGPVLETADGIKVSIDDIVICETCIRRATDLLPEYVEMHEQILAAQRDTQRAWEYATSLKNALDAMKRVEAAKIDEPKRTPPRRPRRTVEA